jgi:hypothetical protein
MQYMTHHHRTDPARRRGERVRSARRTRGAAAAVATFASLVLGATALTGASASAATPDIQDVEIDEEERFRAGELCPFEVVLQGAVRARITVWSDDNGEVSKGRIHIQGTTHVSSEHGSAVNRWVENIQLDTATMTEARTGNSFNVHAGPGGVLVNDSGRVVLDVNGDTVFAAGPRATPEEFAELCAHLAP